MSRTPRRRTKACERGDRIGHVDAWRAVRGRAGGGGARVRMGADASDAQPAMPAPPQHLQPHATSDAHRPAAAAPPVARNRPLLIGCAARTMRADASGCSHECVNGDTCDPPVASHGPLRPSIAPARQARRRSTRTHLVRVSPQPILTRAGADRRTARAFATGSSRPPGCAPRLRSPPPSCSRRYMRARGRRRARFGWHSTVACTHAPPPPPQQLLHARRRRPASTTARQRAPRHWQAPPHRIPSPDHTAAATARRRHHAGMKWDAMMSPANSTAAMRGVGKP
jgi:hypothetical protein